MTVFLLSMVLTSGALALVAYLQANMAWWKGLFAALTLFLSALTIGFITEQPDPNYNAYSPSRFLMISMWGCAALIAIGSVAGLILRNFFSAMKVGKITFFSSLAAGVILMFYIVSLEN